MNPILVPDYYPKFHCIGAECADTCCSGWWKVSVDEETYQRYEQCQLPELKDLFKLAVSQNPAAADSSAYALMQMKPDGSCHFLQADQQCAIHQKMGATALSDTCRLYPRYLNRFGAQRENSLGISCPEVARLVLLNPQAMQFVLQPAEPDIDSKAFTSYQFPRQTNGDAEQIQVLNDFRALIIAILQCRSLSIGARLMLLGFLLEDADKITAAADFSHAKELLPTLQAYFALLAQPERIEAQFAQIEGDPARKLAWADRLLQHALAGIASPRFRECLNAASAGLGTESALKVARYAQSVSNFYQPYFHDKSYIFENYLVNQVFTRLFPFARDNYLNLYRELVSHFALLEVLLVGMAAQHQGLNEASVLQLFQTFARHSNHHQGYLAQLLAALQPQAEDSFVNIMWLLKSK